MLGWFSKLSQRWAGWISDSDLERSLRAHLSRRGYYGDTAKFISFRLVAIERPGWLQVYSFSVDAARADPTNSTREFDQLFGLVRQDERYGRCDVQVFQNAVERRRLYHEWTEDLLRLRHPNL